MRVTLRDVAGAAGVHPATASRALNPAISHRVSAVTVRKVQRGAQKLGYLPNPIARGLKTIRSSTLGVVIPDLTNPLFPPIVRGIEDVASAAGYSALIVSTDDDVRREAGQVAALRSRQVEGLVFATAVREHPLLRDLVRDWVPVVLVNRIVDGLAASAVIGDDAAGVRAVVDHLVGLGHTRIAHVAGPQVTSTGVARLHAFREALRVNGLTIDDDLVVLAKRYREDAGGRRCAYCSSAGGAQRRSPPTTCWRSGATTPCVMRDWHVLGTSVSSGSTTCPSWTNWTRRSPRCGCRTTGSASRRPGCCSSW
jgi:LacI family transcriptional regulator